MGLGEVLGFLTVNALRGVLTVRGGATGAVALRMYFDEGRIFLPYSDRRAIRDLGQIISPNGRVARAWEHLLKELKTRSDRLQRSVLQADAERAEASPQEEELDVFRWDEARFEFVQSELPEMVHADIRARRCLEISPNELLMDAAKRSDEGARLRKVLSSERLVLAPGGEEPPQVSGLSLSDVDWSQGPTAAELVRSAEEGRQEAMRAVVRAVEQGELRTVTPEEAAARASALLEAGQIAGPLRYLAHLCEGEEYAPTRRSVKLVSDLARSAAFGSGEPVSATLRMDGPRTFGLLIQLLGAQREFSLVLREGDHLQRIERTRDTLLVDGATRGELPSIEVYLARLGHLTTKQFKRVTRSHSRKALSDLVEDKELNEARLERLVEQLADVFFWPMMDVELSNSVGDGADPAAWRAALDDRTLRRVRAGLKHWVGVLGLARGEAAVFVKGPSYKASDPAGRFFAFFSPRRTLGQLRRLAGVGCLQFSQLVAQGLQAGYLRRPSASELLAGVEAARGAGNHPLVYALAHAGAVFGYAEQFVPILAEYRDRELAPRSQASFHGELEGIGLPPILQTLYENRRTGTLTVYGEGREECLYFVEGEAHCLEVEDPVAAEFSEFFLGKSERPATRPATRAAERRELRERFLEVVFWQDANFAFHQNSLPDEFFREGEGITKLPLDTGRFLLEAVHTMSGWDAISEHFPQGVKTVFRFRDREGHLKAVRAHGESRALTLIDGHLSFEELVRRAGESSLHVGQLIAVLVEERLLEPHAVGVGGDQ